MESSSPFEARWGFSRALRIGDRVEVAGTAPIWSDGSCDSDPGAQARRCLEIIERALGELGAGLEHVVRTRMFISDRAHQDAVGEAHGAVFANTRPVATMVVCDLLDPAGRSRSRPRPFCRGPRRQVMRDGWLGEGRVRTGVQISAHDAGSSPWTG